MRTKGRWAGLALGLTLVLVATGVGHAAGATAGLDPRIAEAVESFQPFWSPPDNELKGCRVLIYPAGGSSDTAEGRDRDDLCLWTASHLYHLVRNAGGFPDLRRPDDRLASQPFDQELRAATPGQLCVQLVTIPGEQTTVAPLDAGESSNQLVQALETSGFKLAPADAAVSSCAVGVTIGLPAVDPRRARVGAIPAHRAWAENTYRGLAAYVKSLREQSGAEEDAGDIDPPVVPYYPKHAPSTPVRRAVAAICPDGNLSPERAKWFCDLYVKYAFSDRTNVHFEYTIAVQDQTVVVGGTTNHTALQKTLETMLRAAGIQDVRSEMRLLPEQGRLESDRWFGICVAPMALNFGKPYDGGSLQTQLLFGEPVYLLDRQDGFYLVQGGDGYIGWVRENCIVTLSRAEFKEYTDRPEAVLLEDLALETGRIVRGSRLRVAGVEGGALRVALPDGKQVIVSGLKARLIDDRDKHQARAVAALDLLNVPYLFAGRSSVGLDCSGLVGTICDAYGSVLPRDAAQQFVSGRLVATRWYPEGMRPGDRIYFINETGKIFHTGLSLGGNYFVHSSPPGVQISSFEKGHRLYREHWDVHFLGARRP